MWLRKYTEMKIVFVKNEKNHLYLEVTVDNRILDMLTCITLFLKQILIVILYANSIIKNIIPRPRPGWGIIFQGGNIYLLPKDPKFNIYKIHKQLPKDF